MMSGLIQIEQIGAQIIQPYAETFKRRYSNHADRKQGSRYVNDTPCPLCVKHLRGNSCGDCPMDEAFGVVDKTSMDLSGCKLFIRKMWGPISFGDFPNYILRTERVHNQLQSINTWLRRTFR